MTTVERTITFAWLDLTRKCQQTCGHCYNGSGPDGEHGSMTVLDWLSALDQLADAGVRDVQFIGGEVTLYPHLLELIDHALDRGLQVEVFTNLVHVTEAHWQAFRRPGVRLATSYYSDDPDEHASIVRRPTHGRITANIARAQEYGIPLRAGLIGVKQGQRVEQATERLVALGVPHIGYDKVRGIGRAAEHGCGDSADQLCGACGDGALAIGPDGMVTPCIMSSWLGIGSVRDRSLAALLPGVAAARKTLIEQGMRVEDAAANCPPTAGCPPQGGECYPSNCPPRFRR